MKGEGKMKTKQLPFKSVEEMVECLKKNASSNNMNLVFADFLETCVLHQKSLVEVGVKP